MTIRGSIYRILPDVMRPSIKYAYLKYKYGNADYDIGKIGTNVKEEYTPPIKYKEEIKNSKVYKRKISEYYDLFSVKDGDAACGGLQQDGCYNLYSIVRDKNPSTVVETGVANGVSSLVVLLALEKNGKGNLISIDYPVYLSEKTDELKTQDTDKTGWKIPADKNPGWIVTDDIKKRWELIEGKSVNELPKVVAENGVDIFIHDSQHTTTNMLFEFFLMYNNMESGSNILSDDILSTRAFDIFCSEVEISQREIISQANENDLGYIEI